MRSPLQLTFRDMDPSPSISEYVHKKAAKLDTFHPDLSGCRVSVESPHRHHLHGRRFRVRVDMTLPGTELVASKSDDPGNADVYAAIDDAFDDAQRLLRDHHARERELLTRGHARNG